MGVERERDEARRDADRIVTANSEKRRRGIPPMNRNGRKTATSEIVIDRIVKPISFEPSSAAWNGLAHLDCAGRRFRALTDRVVDDEADGQRSAMSTGCRGCSEQAHHRERREIESASRGWDHRRGELPRKRKITMTTRPR